MWADDKGDRLSERRTVLLQARCRKSSWHVFPVELGDVSQGGCSIVGSSESFAAGETVRLSFGNLKPIDAEVRWQSADKVGVAFRAALEAGVVEELGQAYGIVIGPKTGAPERDPS